MRSTVTVFRRLITRLRPFLLVGLIVACRTDSPVAPGVPPVQPGGVGPVARVVVSATRQALSPGESARFTAQAFDAQGRVLPTAAIVWSSSNPAAASVDAQGMVTAIAAGEAAIMASAEGESGSAVVMVSVTQLCECTRILDSTATALVQRNDTSGVYVFRVLRGTPPPIDSGSIIVGAQDGGFLRRVTRVTRTSDLVTVETIQAYLDEAVQEGSFATTSFSDDESESGDGAANRWGGWVTTYRAAELAQAAAVKCCSLEGLGFNIKLADQAAPVEGSVEFTIKEGGIVFSPRAEIAAHISRFQLQSFRTAFRGDLGLDIDVYEIKVALAATKGLTLLKKESRNFIVQQRPFATFIGPMPVVGIITKSIKLEITPTVGASAIFTGKFRTGFGLMAGAQWTRAGGWSPLAGASSYFDATAPAFQEIQGTASVKIAVVPEFSVQFYGVAGPFVNIEPYAEAAGTAAMPFEAGAIAGLDWETKVSLGMDFNIGAKVSVLGRIDLVQAGFKIPIVKPYPLVRGYSDGPLTVSAAVTGDDGPATLHARVRPAFADTPPPFGRDLSTSTRDTTVAVNDSVTLQRIRSGVSFPHRVSLFDLPGNCTAGDSGQTMIAVGSDAFLALGGTRSAVHFGVSCVPLGSLRVGVVSRGPDPTAFHTVRVTRLDTMGVGKGDTPLAFRLSGNAISRDTVIAGLVPASALTGSNGRHAVEVIPGRRNCAVARPLIRHVTVSSGDTTSAEFPVTCVELGHTLVRTQTLDADLSPATQPITFAPQLVPGDAIDSVTSQPAAVGATGSSVVSQLVPAYGASGATGRYTVRLGGAPNRCTETTSLDRAITVFPGDTAIADFALHCVERLHVSTRATGPGSDHDGYRVIVEYADGSSDSAPIGVRDTLGIPGIRPGRHTIRLADVDPSCTAPPPVAHVVSDRDSSLVSFAVHCAGPAAPTGLRATRVQSTEIDVAWDASPPAMRAAFYRLYRVTAGTSTSPIRFDSLTSLGHHDTGLRAFTSFSYRVAAVDSHGVEGPQSEALVIRTRDGTPPTAPAAVTVTDVGDSHLTLAWVAAADPESGVLRYRIFRDGVLADSTTTRSYTDTPLAPYRTYTYEVRAVNGDGAEGAPSPGVAVRTLDLSPPTVPAALTATPAGSSRIDLAWQAAADPESGVALYRIYRNGVLAGTSATVSYADLSPPAQPTLTYTVTAVNGAGVESAHSQPATVSLTDQTPPSQPAGLSATAVSSAQVNLAWSAATDAESGVARYRIFRNGVLVDSSTTTTATDTGLTASTTYTYEVSAVNGAGLEGARSAPASATTPPPAATGTLEVMTRSRGIGIPAAGYTVELSANGVTISRPIGPDGTVTFTALVPQAYSLLLGSLPSNCAVDDGPNPRTAIITAGGVRRTVFQVLCQ